MQNHISLEIIIHVYQIHGNQMLHIVILGENLEQVQYGVKDMVKLILKQVHGKKIIHVNIMQLLRKLQIVHQKKVMFLN